MGSEVEFENLKAGEEFGDLVFLYLFFPGQVYLQILASRATRTCKKLCKRGREQHYADSCTSRTIVLVALVQLGLPLSSSCLIVLTTC